MRFSPSVIAALVLVSCAPASSLPTARADAVLAGNAAPGATHTFLLDLRFSGGASICSAVLISPRVLLTAAHCVDPAIRGVPSVLVRATNEPDDSMLTLSDFIEVRTVALAPGWNPADDESDFDLAALSLARAPVGVTPLRLSRWLDGAAGRDAEVVGYGRLGDSPDASASSGTRRSVVTPITRVTAANLEFGSPAAGLCLGDSGGPTLIDGALAGIHSRNDATICGNGIDIRVDRHQPFIDGFVAANDPQPCVSDGQCAPGCGVSDPDCRCQHDGRCDAQCGASDADCLADGAGCSSDAQCLGGLCLSPEGVCSRSCAAPADCSPASRCVMGQCRAAPDGGTPDAGEARVDAGAAPGSLPAAGEVLPAAGCSAAPGVPLGAVLLLFLRATSRRAARGARRSS
ncbi:MAG: S1 family peptidase [Myxococcota bacterium]